MRSRLNRQVLVDNVYFDNAATTIPKPERVYGKMDRFMREVGSSAGRAAHHRALDTGRMVYGAREALAALLGVADPLRIAFTKNATEALNIALFGLLAPGDHVVTTSMEHNSVMRPLEALRGRGVDYTVVHCDPDGSLHPKDVAQALKPATAMVAITGASNVTGTIMPVAEVAELAHSAGALLLVDAAQTAGRLAIDVQRDGVDLLAFTGHKELFGPQGTGGLFIREGLAVKPITVGGTGSLSTSLEQPTMMPDVCESGTLNGPGIAGLAAGVGYVREIGVDTIRGHELALLTRAMEGLSRLPGVKVHGPTDPELRVGIIPLTFEALDPQEAAEVLDRRYDIACRAGLHCSPAAHRTMGTLESGALRVSFSHLNTLDQVEFLIDCLGEMAK